MKNNHNQTLYWVTTPGIRTKRIITHTVKYFRNTRVVLEVSTDMKFDLTDGGTV